MKTVRIPALPGIALMVVVAGLPSTAQSPSPATTTPRTAQSAAPNSGQVNERKAREMAWQGNQLYDEGNFAEAEQFFRKALEQSQSMTEGLFNLGNATYRQDRFDEAAARYGEVAAKTTLPAAERADAFYNQGNAYFEGEDYRKAVEAYKQSLRLRPGDANTKHNLSLAQAMLKKQEEQQQNQQNQDQNQQDQQDKQQQQDQQQQDQQNQNQENQQNQNQQNQDQKGDQQEGEPQERNMSPEELERILEALEQDEKDVQQKINAQKVKGVRNESEKDW